MLRACQYGTRSSVDASLKAVGIKGCGHTFLLVSDQNQKARFENTETGFRVSTSVGGAATGEGGRYLVCDDPIKVGDSGSEKIRDQVIQWWTEEMSTRGNDPKKVAKVIIAQRVHENDLCGYLLRQGGYEHLCLAAEFDGHRSKTSLDFKDPRKNHGELLWENRFGREEIDAPQEEPWIICSSGTASAASGPRWWRSISRLMVEVLV